MMWSWDGNGWGYGAVMMFGMVAFWGIVAWALVSVLRSGTASSIDRDSAEEILRQRYARGDVDEDEFLRKSQNLEKTPR